MAFKGIDFGKLLQDSRERAAMDPAARKELEAREAFATDAREVVKDDDMRIAFSLERRVVTLGAEPDVRFHSQFKDVEGERRTDAIIGLNYLPDGGEITSANVDRREKAVFYPSEADRIADRDARGEGLDRHLPGLEQGAKVTMLGKSVPRKWKDGSDRWRTTHEFHAMRMGVGELTREQLVSVDPGGLVSASRRYVSAETDQQREDVAREFLGQEPRSAKLPVRGPSAGMDDGVAVADVSKGGQGR
jgi:hypothetical protein